MLVTIYLAVTFAAGLGAALQIALVASLGRQLGSQEAAWISILGTVFGLLLLLIAKVARGGESGFHAPLDRVAVLSLAMAVILVVLIGSVRDVESYYAATGLLATVGLFAIALFVPRVGIALFFTVFTFGSVTAALLLDHVGALGAAPEPASLIRVLGVGTVAVGSVVVRLAD
jgi:transporter family-2 protein